jgi:hypothetical protein
VDSLIKFMVVMIFLKLYPPSEALNDSVLALCGIVSLLFAMMYALYYVARGIAWLVKFTDPPERARPAQPQNQPLNIGRKPD